jgi:hypothetical protein
LTDEPVPGSSTSLTRHGLEEVIRRAVELSLDASDASEQISEDELMRIAEELGLSARHVRQALYERPIEVQQETFLDRHFGPASVTAVRPVACEQRIAHGRLEDYLVTREYLQIRRRQGPNAFFEPADDAFSSIARAFSRPAGRFHLARAQRAYLSIRPLEPGWCHVRLEMSYATRRKEQAALGGGLGGFVGLLVGSLTAAGIAIGMDPGVLGGAAAAVGGVVAGGGVFTAIWTGTRSGYRKWLERSRDEAEALLDRLEHHEQLQPPSSPWMRRLQQRLRNFGRRDA